MSGAAKGLTSVQKCNIPECETTHAVTCPNCLAPYCSEEHRALGVERGHASECRRVKPRMGKHAPCVNVDGKVSEGLGKNDRKVRFDSGPQYSSVGPAKEFPGGGASSGDDISTRGRSNTRWVEEARDGLSRQRSMSRSRRRSTSRKARNRGTAPEGADRGGFAEARREVGHDDGKKDAFQQRHTSVTLPDGCHGTPAAPPTPSYAPFSAKFSRFIPSGMRALVKEGTQLMPCTDICDDGVGLAEEIGPEIFRSMKNIKEFYYPGERVIVVPTFQAKDTGVYWAILLPFDVRRRLVFLRALQDTLNLGFGEEAPLSAFSEGDPLYVYRDDHLCRAIVTCDFSCEPIVTNVDCGILFRLKDGGGVKRASRELWMPPTALPLVLPHGCPELISQPVVDLEMVWEGGGALRTRDGHVIRVLDWDEGLLMRFAGSCVVPRAQLACGVHPARLLACHDRTVEFLVGREEAELNAMRVKMRDIVEICRKKVGCRFGSGDVGFTDWPKYKEPRRFLVLRCNEEASYLDVTFFDDGGADRVPKKHCHWLSLALTKIPSFINTIHLRRFTDPERLKLVNDCIGLGVIVCQPEFSGNTVNVLLDGDVSVVGSLLQNTLPEECGYRGACIARLRSAYDDSAGAKVPDGGTRDEQRTDSQETESQPEASARPETTLETDTMGVAIRKPSDISAEAELVERASSPATLPAGPEKDERRPPAHRSGLLFRDLEEGSVVVVLVLGVPDVGGPDWGYDFAGAPVSALAELRATLALVGPVHDVGLGAAVVEAPVLGDVVLAKDSDGNFKRAFVGPNRKVSFVDTGNVGEVERGDIRQIPPSLLERRAAASLFALESDSDDFRVKNRERIRDALVRGVPFRLRLRVGKRRGEDWVCYSATLIRFEFI